jgi:hypothetical protein
LSFLIGGHATATIPRAVFRVWWRDSLFVKMSFVGH